MIKVVDAPEITWQFHGGPTIEVGQTPYAASIDPFPGYPHDRDLAETAARLCDGVFPLHHDVHVMLSRHEGVERTNGWTFGDYDYDADVDEATWQHIIFLAGKRIPPHPAVTRYVIPHEYGHAAMYELAKARGQRTSEVEDEYAAMRGLESPPSAHGGTWHAAAAEVAACDFRVMMTGSETAYWPHDGIPNPIYRGDPARRIQNWWDEALDEINTAFGTPDGEMAS